MGANCIPLHVFLFPLVRQNRDTGLDSLQPRWQNADGHKVRVRKIAVVLGILFGSHGICLPRSLIKPPGLLHDGLPLFQQLHLPAKFVLNSLLDELE